MRVWIDLSNSPHPLLFEPLVADLRDAGHETLITARDHAQTADLARERFEGVTLIGAAARRGRLGKLAELSGRVARLASWARERRPDVSLSHGSYAQIVAARALRIPIATAMDFEYQPANHLAFRLADRIIVPIALPKRQLARQGASSRKLVRYEGFKEEIYLGEAEPDTAVLDELELTLGVGEALAVARSAPAGAAYHPGENPLFEQCVRVLDAQPHVRTVILARHPGQRQALRAIGLERCLIPEQALDARSLMHAADAFVGAGGTMSREAALLGVPTWSLFAGPIPAVDARLEQTGRMRRLTDPGELANLAARPPGAMDARIAEIRAHGLAIRRIFVETLNQIVSPE